MKLDIMYNNAGVPRTVSTPDGIALAVRDHGEKDWPAVLLLPGYPDNKRCGTAWCRCWPTGSRCSATTCAELLIRRRRAARRDTRWQRCPPTRWLCSTRSGQRNSVHLVGHDRGSIQPSEAVCDPALAHRIASFTSICGPCRDHAAVWLCERWRNPRTRPRALRQLARSWLSGVLLVRWIGEFAAAAEQTGAPGPGRPAGR